MNIEPISKKHGMLDLIKKSEDRGEKKRQILHDLIPQKLHLHPWITYLILGELLGGAAYLSVLISKGVMTWIGPLAAMYAIVFMVLGAGPVWMKKELESLLPFLNSFVNWPSEKIHSWYINQVEKIFKTSGMIISGCALMVVAMVSFIIQSRWYTYPEIWWGTTAGDIVVSIVVAILAFLFGMALYMVIFIGIMVHQLPKLPLRMTIYQHPTAGISMIGTVMQRITILAAICFGLFVITAVFISPFSKEMGWILIAWLSFASLVLILFFVIPQYSIHMAMTNAKVQKIRTFSNHLSEAIETCIECPTSDKVERVKELFEIYDHLLQMPEWPFNLRSLVSIISAVILPVILSVVQKLLMP